MTNKEELLATLKDMNKINPKYFDKIAELEKELCIEPKEKDEWTKAHSRCQSCAEKTLELSKKVNGANKKEILAIHSVMCDLIQESPFDMEERVKNLFHQVWQNVG